MTHLLASSGQQSWFKAGQPVPEHSPLPSGCSLLPPPTHVDCVDCPVLRPSSPCSVGAEFWGTVVFTGQGIVLAQSQYAGVCVLGSHSLSAICFFDV